MYRSEEFEKAAEGRSVLDIALDVHMRNTGSFEVFDPNDEIYLRDKGLLWDVFTNWESSKCAFDDAVLALIRITINEKKWNAK